MIQSLAVVDGASVSACVNSLLLLRDVEGDASRRVTRTGKRFDAMITGIDVFQPSLAPLLLWLLVASSVSCSGAMLPSTR